MKESTPELAKQARVISYSRAGFGKSGASTRPGSAQLSVSEPLAVITAMKPCPPEREWTCRDPRALEVWRQLHAEWSARNTSSLHLVSARTGHYVMNEQPALIVDAVRFVLDQVRGTVR